MSKKLYRRLSLLLALVMTAALLCVPAFAANVTFAFEQAEQAARDAGFTELWAFDGKHFLPREL